MANLIGTSPDQVSLNGMLGDMAFQNKDSVVVTALSVTGSITTGTQFVSTLATGTAPFSVASTTAVANLNIGGNAAGLSATLAIGSGGTNSTASATAGGVGYGTGTAYAFTAVGTSGQVLTSAGVGAPTWTTPSVSGISGTLAQYNTSLTDADFASNLTNTFSGAQIGSVTALTSSANTIAINLATNNNFSHTTGENTMLSAPSNPVAGQSGVITITQGATARTLAYNTFWKFAGGIVPTLTATVGAIDTFVYNVESATRATCQLIKDVK